MVSTTKAIPSFASRGENVEHPFRPGTSQQQKMPWNNVTIERFYGEATQADRQAKYFALTTMR
jgi:hypothetical protein